MKKITAVMLVLVAVLGMAFPVLGASSGSSTGAGITSGGNAWSMAITLAGTGDSEAGAGTISAGDNYATSSVGSTAQDHVLTDGESSSAVTSGSGDIFSASGAGASAENTWTGEASTLSTSEALGNGIVDASTGAESGAGYEWHPSTGDELIVVAGSGASADGAATSANTQGFAETTWGPPTDSVGSASVSGASGNIVATGGSDLAGDIDGDGNPDASSHAWAGASGIGGSSSIAGSLSASIWE